NTASNKQGISSYGTEDYSVPLFLPSGFQGGYSVPVTAQDSRGRLPDTTGHAVPLTWQDQFPNQVIFPSQSSSALRTVLFSAVGFCTVQKSTTPVQKATRPGAAATARAGPGKIVDNGVGIYTAAVAVECLYLFDMFLYAPEGAAVPAVAADGAAISCIFCSERAAASAGQSRRSR
ncbi:hypothetical protein THAOC_12845, partial [Thalassiosira oceanica]